jgi:hypothetical protein
MAALPVRNCLENMDMDGVRHKCLRDFKGYSFHSFYLSIGLPGSRIPVQVCQERITIYS